MKKVVIFFVFFFFLTLMYNPINADGSKFQHKSSSLKNEKANVNLLLNTQFNDVIVIILTVGNTKAIVNNVAVTLDAPPIINNGRTLVPVRFISEAFGAKVDWEPYTQRIVITLGEEPLGTSVLNIQDKWIYYMDKEGFLCKVNVDGSGKLKINDNQLSKSVDMPQSFIVKDDWIYYSYSNIYKIRTNGTGKTIIFKKNSEERIQLEYMKGDWLYFLLSDNKKGGIYRIRSNGKDLMKIAEIPNFNASKYNWFYISGEWIYYYSYEYSSDEDNGWSIFRIKIDGTNKTKILHKEGSKELVISGDWIYYLKNYEGLYKIRTDGTGKMLISKDIESSYKIVGDWIYYNSLKEDKMYKIRTDGTGKKLLCEDRASIGKCIGDWLFYRNRDDDNTIYKIRTDGTSRMKIIDDETLVYIVEGDWIYYQNYQWEVCKIRTDGTDRQLFE